MVPRLTRRQGLLLLAGLPVLGAAACSTDVEPPAPTASPPGPGDPAADDERALITRYEATIAAHPGLAVTLTPIIGQHRAHLQALVGPDAEAGPPVDAVPTVPGDARAAVAALAQAERAASRQRIDACASAESSERARVLAFIAASEASHAVELGRADG
jgi:hypothetical protein